MKQGQMKTCKTCKHWIGPDDLEQPSFSLVGMCTYVRMFWHVTEWDKEGTGRKLIDKYKDLKAFVQDGSDYRAELLTKPDFGCISHEAIDEDK